MAHLRRAFSRPAWNFSIVRAIVSLLHSSAQVSERAPLPPARDTVFSVPDRFLPAAFERRRSLVLQARPATPSPHPPSCPAGDRFLRAPGALRHCQDLLRARREIPSRRPPRALRKVPAGRAECAPQVYRLILRLRVHLLKAQIPGPRGARRSEERRVGKE